MHYHAYQWNGGTAQLERADGVRRPPLAPSDPAPFIGSPLPPFRLCDWLLKPRTRIEQTFAGAEAALEWLATRYAEVMPSFHLPDQETRIGEDARLGNATYDLNGGVDVCWGFYLRGERYVHIAMVCCPNRHAPGYPCPSGGR
ncbi:hypothetical protein [Streptosporangium carneum]|uniref:Uncharacterized protein n=1 Tax=Streptosporangium carneum TaxID=47481 RepID=A0A9W6I5K3_9ACTN|nr:hypothetical protein [Streptosporangium carneum]GLK11624.1 hypothetical protein GCM10017600_50310 [Streptosporangium carneum]